MNFKSLAVLLFAVALWTQPLHAESRKGQNIGVGLGAVIGAAAGGPIGFFVGVVSGAKIGDNVDKKTDENQHMAASLEVSNAEQAMLTRKIAQQETELAEVNENLRALNDSPMTDAYALLRRGIDIEVFFDTDDYTVDIHAARKLAQLATVLSELDGVKIQLDGFADSRGSQRYNEMLSMQRANTVRDLLAEAGLDVAKIAVEAHGSEIDEGNLDSQAALQTQRRVAIRLSIDENLADQQIAGL